MLDRYRGTQDTKTYTKTEAEARSRQGQRPKQRQIQRRSERERETVTGSGSWTDTEAHKRQRHIQRQRQRQRSRQGHIHRDRDRGRYRANSGLGLLNVRTTQRTVKARANSNYWIQLGGVNPTRGRGHGAAVGRRMEWDVQISAIVIRPLGIVMEPYHAIRSLHGSAKLY